MIGLTPAYQNTGTLAHQRCPNTSVPESRNLCACPYISLHLISLTSRAPYIPCPLQLVPIILLSISVILPPISFLAFITSRFFHISSVNLKILSAVRAPSGSFSNCAFIFSAFLAAINRMSRPLEPPAADWAYLCFRPESDRDIFLQILHQLFTIAEPQRFL